MFRLFVPGIAGIVVLALWVYCLFDVIASEAMLIRNLPKMAWLLIVLLLGVFGSVAWLLLGRPLNAGWRPGDTEYRRPVRKIWSPEDDPSWGSGAQGSREGRLSQWEADLERRERDLRRQGQKPAEGTDKPDANPPAAEEGGEFPFRW